MMNKEFYELQKNGKPVGAFRTAEEAIKHYQSLSVSAGDDWRLVHAVLCGAGARDSLNDKQTI